MKKYYTNGTNRILIKFIIKALLTSVLTILFFSFISSELIFKLDLDLNSVNMISIFIVALSSLITSFISVYGIKNNGAIFGVLSQIPLLFYMIVNVIFNGSSVPLLFVKVLILGLVGCLTGMFSSSKSKKIKVH